MRARAARWSRKEEMARELRLEQGKRYAAEAIPDVEEMAENLRRA